MCHSRKKPKTRNNEILSSYSSSKFLLKSGQKRPYPRGNYFYLNIIWVCNIHMNYKERLYFINICQICVVFIRLQNYIFTLLFNFKIIFI
jgi:hypothetical protein